MSLSTADHFWHSVYEAFSPAFRIAIDEAYTLARRELENQTKGLDHKIILFNTDDAKAFVAAITRYLVESNPSHPEIVSTLAAVNADDEQHNAQFLAQSKVLPLTVFADGTRAGANASNNPAHWDAIKLGLHPVTAQWLMDHPEVDGWFYVNHPSDGEIGRFVQIGGVDANLDRAEIYLDYGRSRTKTVTPIDEVFVKSEAANS